MTVAATVRKAGPTPGNGLTTVFPFAFKVFVATDIRVQQTVIATGVISTLVLNDPLGYTVALNPDQNANPGGSITYNPLGVPMPATLTLTIDSVVPQVQGTHIINGGAFFANNIEDAVDKVCINVQDQAAKIGSAIQFPSADAAGLISILPAAALRANQVCAFDGAGNVIAAAGGSNIPIAAAWAPVVQAGTLAAGELILGFNRESLWCGNAGGTANAITLATGANLAALRSGGEFVWKATANNTAATTIAIDTAGAKTAQVDGNAMIGGEIVSGKWYRSTYDGANLQTERLFFAQGGIVASPAQITAAQNDYAPAGIASAHTLRINSDARRALTGITSGVDGRTIQIHNVGTFPITFKQEDAGSTAANRFAFGHTLSGQHTLRIQYDGTTARWRCVAKEDPAGTLKDFAGGTVPEGYLARDGSNISRTTWASLFNEVGTTWGVGDGSTTFGVGDDRRRSSIGSGGAGTGTIGNAVGNVGGEEGHPLSLAEGPAHPHSTATGDRFVTLSNGADGGQVAAAAGGDAIQGTGGTTSNTTASSGSGTAHNTYHPAYVVTKIIKT